LKVLMKESIIIRNGPTSSISQETTSQGIRKETMLLLEFSFYPVYILGPGRAARYFHTFQCCQAFKRWTGGWFTLPNFNFLVGEQMPTLNVISHFLSSLLKGLYTGHNNQSTTDTCIKLCTNIFLDKKYCWAQNSIFLVFSIWRGCLHTGGEKSSNEC
jgi:hypothetical protein